MQLFAGELTNQNREYYKVNDNKQELCDSIRTVINKILIGGVILFARS